jgi:hypothetical protein
MINLDCKTDKCVVCLETDDLTDLVQFGQIVPDCKCQAFYHNLCLIEWIRHDGTRKCMICKKIDNTMTGNNDPIFDPYYCFLDTLMDLVVEMLDLGVLRIIDVMLCQDPQNLSNINQMVYQLYVIVRNIICSILIIAIYLKVTFVVAIICVLKGLQICTVKFLEFVGIGHLDVIIASLSVCAILSANDYFGYILYGNEFF